MQLLLFELIDSIKIDYTLQHMINKQGVYVLFNWGKPECYGGVTWDVSDHISVLYIVSSVYCACSNMCTFAWQTQVITNRTGIPTSHTHTHTYTSTFHDMHFTHHNVLVDLLSICVM